MIGYLYHCYFRPLVEAFRAPDKVTLMLRELAEAERRLLVAQSGLDYAKAMVTYEQSRVSRLSKIPNPIKPPLEIPYANPNSRASVKRVH